MLLEHYTYRATIDDVLDANEVRLAGLTWHEAARANAKRDAAIKRRQSQRGKRG